MAKASPKLAAIVVIKVMLCGIGWSSLIFKKTAESTASKLAGFFPVHTINVRDGQCIPAELTITDKVFLAAVFLAVSRYFLSGDNQVNNSNHVDDIAVPLAEAKEGHEELTDQDMLDGSA